MLDQLVFQAYQDLEECQVLLETLDLRASKATMQVSLPSVPLRIANWRQLVKIDWLKCDIEQLIVDSMLVDSMLVEEYIFFIGRSGQTGAHWRTRNQRCSWNSRWQRWCWTSRRCRTKGSTQFFVSENLLGKKLSPDAYFVTIFTNFFAKIYFHHWLSYVVSCEYINYWM